jgi:hypothetical protein
MTVLREKPSGSPVFTFEGRRKKEEGRRKKEEGRRKKEEKFS